MIWTSYCIFPITHSGLSFHGEQTIVRKLCISRFQEFSGITVWIYLKQTIRWWCSWDSPPCTQHGTNQKMAFIFTLNAFSSETYKTNVEWLSNHSNLSETAWYFPSLSGSRSSFYWHWKVSTDPWVSLIEPSDLSDLGEWSPRIEGNQAWIPQNWACRLFLRASIHLAE